jgi:uncharacterized protein GlcG (DUF336 family)
MPYPELFVAPMRQELTRFGVKELRTADDVDTAVTATSGTLMIIVNSVCGCAAGKARPGVAMALTHANRPISSRRFRRRRRRCHRLPGAISPVTRPRRLRWDCSKTASCLHAERSRSRIATRRKSRRCSRLRSTVLRRPVSVQLTCPLRPTYHDRAGEEGRSGALAGRAQQLVDGRGVVDPGGILVYFERMDDTQNASSKIAIDKAYRPLFKRPTKTFQDPSNAGASAFAWTFEAQCSVEGGVPLIVDGKIVGGLGVSGGTAEQDGQCAKAATDAM